MMYLYFQGFPFVINIKKNNINNYNWSWINRSSSYSQWLKLFISTKKDDMQEER
jgi:hypothetical protein